MTARFQRQTAFRLWISDIINAQFVNPKQEFTPSYIITRELHVSRVNFISICIEKQITENYGFIVVDDSSAQIQITAWNEDVNILKNIQCEQILNIIGKVRYFNNQVYISPEIIREVEREWLKIRILELKRLYGEPIKEEKIKQKVMFIDAGDMSPLSKREIILKLIEKLDEKYGADIIEVIKQSKLQQQDAENIIKELIKEGEIFEIKSGHLRTIM